MERLGASVALWRDAAWTSQAIRRGKLLADPPAVVVKALSNLADAPTRRATYARRIESAWREWLALPHAELVRLAPAGCAGDDFQPWRHMNRCNHVVCTACVAAPAEPCPAV